MSENSTSGIERNSCAIGGCSEDPSELVKIMRGDTSWVDAYCEYHVKMQLDLEADARKVDTGTDGGRGDE